MLYTHAQYEKIYSSVDAELVKSAERLARECQASIMGRQGKWLETLVSTWDKYVERVVSGKECDGVMVVLMGRAYCPPSLSTSTVSMPKREAVSPPFGELACNAGVGPLLT